MLAPYSPRTTGISSKNLLVLRQEVTSSEIVVPCDDESGIGYSHHGMRTPKESWDSGDSHSLLEDALEYFLSEDAKILCLFETKVSTQSQVPGLPKPSASVFIVAVTSRGLENNCPYTAILFSHGHCYRRGDHCASHHARPCFWGVR